MAALRGVPNCLLPVLRRRPRPDAAGGSGGNHVASRALFIGKTSFGDGDVTVYCRLSFSLKESGEVRGPKRRRAEATVSADFGAPSALRRGSAPRMSTRPHPFRMVVRSSVGCTRGKQVNHLENQHGIKGE